MPAGLIKSLAEQYSVSVDTVERAWAHCKAAIHPSEFGEGAGYGVVVNCVKSKLGKRSKAKAARAVKEARK